MPNKARLTLLAVTACVLLLATKASAAIGIDQTVSKDQGTASTTVVAGPLSTTAGNELLLACVDADGPTSGTNTIVSSIATPGLTWALVQRTNTQRGTAEIWRAFAVSPLTNVTVTATLSRSESSSLTIMTFTGVDTTGTNGSGAIGNIGTGNSSKGAPTASLTTTRNSSLVIGVGNDWDNAISRTPGTGQTVVHQFLAPVGDTYWVQRQTNPTAASGTVVTINDTAPTGDRYDLSIAEIRVAAATSTITATAGTPQSSTVNTAFVTNLQATVKDGSNNPVVGTTVTFTAPGSGATGSFASGANTAVTNSSGVAVAAVFTANTTAGNYTVTAGASGVTSPASFLLTNAPGSPASVAATAGASQSATVNTAFATNLQVTVKDTYGNAVNGATVTFTAPGSGASGSFAGGTNTANTNSNGIATAVQFTANGITGAYTVTAAVPGATSASFSLTNNPPPPASITATLGTPQSATINSAFATNLQATVRDAGNNPLGGVTVTFAAPGAGASGTFTGGNTAVTNSIGVATANVFTANSTAGAYTVSASVVGVSTSASFNLTNTPGLPATVSTTAGTPQSATVNSAFATKLQATVKDAGSNGVPGVTVTFTPPSSGASGTFANGVNTAVTDSNGIATAQVFTANGTPGGPYTVTASASGATSANFSLTNTTAQPASIAATAGTLQSATVNTAFGTALQATVKDASNNPVVGATVTFADPVSGPSGTFGGSTGVPTDSNGMATAPIFTANSIAGSYTVTASVSGVSAPAFSLTNNPATGSGVKLIQSSTVGNENGTSNMSLPFASNNTAGDFLIVTGTAARPATTLTITDTLNNAYSTAFGPVTDTTQNVTMYIWYVPVCKGGANTVTITPSVTAALEIHVSEWTGLATTSPVDQTTSATGTGTSVSSGAVTTSMNGELIFGYGWVFNTATAGAGFTPISLVNGDLDEYQVQSAAGSIAATFTQTTGTWFAAVVTFKPIGWSISGNLSGGAGAQVTLSGTSSGSVTADSSGNFTFNGLNNGTYIVTPSGPAFDFDPHSQTVAMNGAPLTGVNFTAGVATDWLMVDHDQSRTGNAFEENTLTTSNVGNLQFDWSKTLDGSLTAQPLFVHNILISGQTRDILVEGTGGNSIYVLDASNGTVIWNRNFGAPTPNTWGIPDGFGIEAPPFIDRTANRIYTVSTDGNFRTISLLDGTDVYPALLLIANSDTNKVWGGLNKVNNSVYVVSASNGGDVAPWRGQTYQIDVSATPTLKGDFVVVPSIAAPNGGGGIWGYGGASADVVSGNIFVTTSFDSNVSGNGNEQTALYSNSVIALGANANLLGYYQAPPPNNIPCDGAPCDLDFASTPLYFQPPGCSAMVAGGSKNGNLYLFRVADLIASGQPLQVLTLNAPQDSLGSGGVGGVPAYSPALNMVYITDAGPGVTGVAAGVVGLNITSGCTFQVAWSDALGGSDTPNSTPTVANGIVFVGEGLTGLVHAYNAQTGVQLWQSPSQYKAGATFAAPTVAGGKVYASSWASLSSGGGLVGAFSLPVTTPILTVSPSSLSFSASLGGGNPPPSSISVTNTGAGTLNFTASSDSSWLTVSPLSGTAPQSLQATASIAGLAAGTYTGHVTITSSGAQGSPATVTVTLTVSNSSGTSTLSIDVTAPKDNNTASKTIVSPTFSTTSTNELLLAFVGSDFQPSQSSTNVSVTGITGAGLTWVLVQRMNVQSGTAEIWRAFAASQLSNVTVTATLSQSVQSSMTVMSFAGVDTTGTNGSGAIGAVGSGNSAKGAPTATLVSTRNNSWVVAAGDDYDNAIARTLGPGQTLIHQDLSPINDTYWAQRETNATPVAGTSVTINDTAPTTDRFDLALCEVLPALIASQSPQTWSITGTITPAANGSGATVALTGTSSGTVTADPTGTYMFTGVGNGSYTVTPSKPGFTFNPASQPATVSGGNATVTSFSASQLPLAISPRVVALTFSATQQFTALNATGGVNWSVDGVAGGSAASGTITVNGLYALPSVAGTHTVTVTSSDLSQSASATVYVTNYPGTFTYHNDNLRTGQNSGETVLTTTNVNSTKFGKLLSYPTDGTSYASPLYAANVAIPGNGFHNVVYVATAHDSVYAFDADTPGANPLWKVSFLTGSGVTTVPSTDAGDCCDMAPEIGITGTPVIDPNTGTLYVVAKTKEVVGTTTNYVQRLHALDITNGAEKFSGPVVIQASVPGTGDGVSAGSVAFDSLHENQRPALLWSNGVVYIGFAAHGDVHPWHGWLLGYNASNVQQQVMVYNVSANGYGGGIWQSGGGPGVDASGNIYLATGNGTFDANTGGIDYGDSVEKLSTSGAVLDYFTPHDQDNLNTGDLDLGSAGPVLLLDQSTGSFPHIMITAGKGGTIYVINRDNMGHYNASNDNQIIQELVGALPNGTVDTGNFSAPVYFNGYVYFGAVSDTVKAFQLSNGMLNAVPSSHTPETYQNRGGTFAISANGTTNGILWTVQDNGAGTPGILYAYDATNLATELYNSSQSGTRDTLDVAAKFNIPLVANGKVFVVTKSTLTVFGPLP